jgi:hypothetical protein
MRSLGAWGLSLALVLGSGSAVSAADDGDGNDKPAASKTGGSWLKNWFTPGGKEADKPKPQEKKAEAEESRPLAKPPSAVEGAAVQRKREEAKYFRRSAVCLKLKEIAEETDDHELRRRAEQLEQRAWAVYIERTRNLPSSQAVFESDVKTIDKQVGKERPQERAVVGGMITVPGKAGAKEDGR